MAGNKSTLMGFILMAAIILASGLQASAAEVTLLSNGLPVLVQEDERFPLVSIRLYVNAGSAYEQPETAGISHLLEHMVFKGTQKRAPGEVASTIEGAGGYLNAATGFDYTVYKIDLPAEKWPLGLDVLQDMVFGAAIDPQELEQEKNVVLSELERGEDNPNRTLFLSLQPLIWPGTPYERPVIGFRDTVQKITRGDILEYIDKFYQPQKMLLVVCGNVKRPQVLEEVDRLFGNLQNSGKMLPAAPQPLSPSLELAPQVRVSPGPWNKAYMSVAFPLPGFKTEESAAIEVLAQLLGGDQTAKLYRKFKYEEQLVDEISVSPLMLERGGMLYIQAQLDPDKVGVFWEGLATELASIQASDFTDQELQRAKLNLEDSLFQTMETLGGLASKLGFFQFFENGLEAEDRYLYTLRNLDLDQIQEVIDSYFQVNLLRASLLVPEEVRLPEEALKETLLKQWTAGDKPSPMEIVAEESPAEATRIVDLGQGRTLVHIPDDTLPYTALTLTWPGGDTLLGPDQQGVAELVSRVLMRGTKNRSATEIQDFLSDRAASLDAYAGREHFTIGAKFLSRYQEDMTDLLIELITAPSFPAEEVDREVNDQIADIREREDQPLGLAFRNLFPFLFKDHPYGYYHLGMTEELPLFGRDLVRSQWEEQRKQPWVLSVCGKIRLEDARALADRLTKAMETGDRLGFTEPTWTEERQAELRLEERNQAHLLVVFPVPALMSDETPAVSLLRTVLAGQGGMLFRELRDVQGLGYTVTAMLWQTPRTGFMAFYIGTSPDKVDQAREGFRKIVDRLHKSELREEDLSRAKNLMEGEYYRDHQSLLSRSSEAAGLLAKGLPLSYNRDLIDQVQELTPKDLQTFARKHLIWDSAYVMQVLP
ncbi:MAG: M16 family metallopeptidase [Desulfovibrionales bacterium]